MDSVHQFYENKDLSLLKKLTLIIPTYNRNFYLSRCLWYHAHFPFGEIIVADSSPEEKKVVNRETVRKIREMFDANIRYLEYEPETEKYGGDIFRKWGDAVQHVGTEYSQFCADKEFLIPTTLCDCIDFLSQNSDYSVAEGCFYRVTYDNDKNIYSHTLWQSKDSLMTNDPISRMCLSIMIGVFPVLGLHRSIQHKKIYQNYCDYNINDLRFGEVIIELQDIIFGKYYRFSDLPHVCRDVIHLGDEWRPNKSESSTLRYPAFWEYPEIMIQDKILLTNECLKQSLINEYGSNTENFDEFLETFLPYYLDKRFNITNPLLKNSKLFRLIWSLAPQSLKKIVKNRFGIQNDSDLNSHTLTPEMQLINYTLKIYKEV